MKPQGAKAKGSRAEREVVEIWRRHGYNVHRTPYSGALWWQKGDLAGLKDFHVEVKHQERLCLPEWIRTAEAQAHEKIALVVFRQNRGEWQVCLKLEDFLGLLERSDG